MWALTGCTSLPIPPGLRLGNIIGVMLEERIAMGYSLVRIFTHKHGFEMAEALRNADFGATEIFGQGRDGTVYIVETVVRRKDLPFVQKLARDMDAKAFLVVDEARRSVPGLPQPQMSANPSRRIRREPRKVLFLLPLSS